MIPGNSIFSESLNLIQINKFSIYKFKESIQYLFIYSFSTSGIVQKLINSRSAFL